MFLVAVSVFPAYYHTDHFSHIVIHVGSIAQFGFIDENLQIVICLFHCECLVGGSGGTEISEAGLLHLGESVVGDDAGVSSFGRFGHSDDGCRNKTGENQ